MINKEKNISRPIFQFKGFLLPAIWCVLLLLVLSLYPVLSSESGKIIDGEVLFYNSSQTLPVKTEFDAKEGLSVFDKYIELNSSYNTLAINAYFAPAKSDAKSFDAEITVTSPDGGIILNETKRPSQNILSSEGENMLRWSKIAAFKVDKDGLYHIVVKITPPSEGTPPPFVIELRKNTLASVFWIGYAFFAMLLVYPFFVNYKFLGVSLRRHFSGKPPRIFNTSTAVPDSDAMRIRFSAYPFCVNHVCALAVILIFLISGPALARTSMYPIALLFCAIAMYYIISSLGKKIEIGGGILSYRNGFFKTRRISLANIRSVKFVFFYMGFEMKDARGLRGISRYLKITPYGNSAPFYIKLPCFSAKKAIQLCKILEVAAKSNRRANEK